MNKPFDGASAPTTELCPKHAGAAQRHLVIGIVQDGLRDTLPVAVMMMALACASAPAAVIGGLAMASVQSYAQLIVARLPDLEETFALDIDGAILIEEGLPIGVGAVAAVIGAMCVSSIPLPWLCASALIGVLLMFWQYAFHRWCGGHPTDFEKMSAHPCTNCRTRVSSGQR